MTGQSRLWRFLSFQKEEDLVRAVSSEISQRTVFTRAEP